MHADQKKAVGVRTLNIHTADAIVGEGGGSSLRMLRAPFAHTP